MNTNFNPRRWQITALICGCMVAACSGGSDKAGVPDSFNGVTLIAAADQLEQLVAVGDVAELVGIPAERIAQHVEDYDNNAVRKKIAFHWEAPGTISFTTLTGEAVSVPKHHSVGLANVEAVDMETFNQRYGTSAGIKANIDALVDDESVDADVAIAQVTYLAGTVKGLSLEPLEGVGEGAVWEMPTQVLHVYADGVAFTVTTNFGDDPGINKRKAIAFAQLIFNKPIK